jgi:hypothetical protein
LSNHLKHSGNALLNIKSVHFAHRVFLVFSMIPRTQSDYFPATGYGLDDRGVGVRVPIEARIFISSRRPDRLWGPPNLLSNGYRGLFLPRGVKVLEREADHSPPTIHVHPLHNAVLNLSESYDWRFTVNQFVFAASPLRLTASNFFYSTEHLLS